MDIISTSLDCSSWTKVKDIVTCGYCKQLFTEPYTLLCCHTFCNLCTKTMKDCPTCKQRSKFSLKFENHFLARLTKVFINHQNVDQSCITCKDHTEMCKRCYIIGCFKCNSQRLCGDQSRQHLSHPVNLNASPEELLELFTATGYCEQHTTSELTHYCHKCKAMKCSECLISCRHHKTRLEKANKYFPQLMESFEEVKRSVTNNEHLFLQHKKELDELFEEDFIKVTQWFEHAYNCLYHEKQSTLLRLKMFHHSTNKSIERFHSELDSLMLSITNFQKYFELLFDKSLDHEKHFYNESSLKTSYRVQELEHANEKITKQFQNKLDSKKVFQKGVMQTRTCEGITRCYTKCKKVDNLRSHLNTEQKYKYEVISYHRELNKHDKLETDQVVVKGSCYSMYSLPHASSDLVKYAKQPLTDISKCASCVSQLKLYNKTIIAQCDVEMELKDKGNVIYETVIVYSIKTLHDISENLIHNIEKAILHAHEGNVSMYITVIKNNFTELENFATTIDGLQAWLGRLSSELQSFQTKHLDQPPNIIYSNMLLDIILDCQTYITSIHQIVLNICHTKTKIILVHKENSDETDDEMVDCIITNEGFQIEIISHYSTCVALNEICKALKELINNWIKDQTI